MRYPKPRMARSPRWPAVRSAFLVGKVCAVCGRSDALVPHHIYPVHLFPELELNPGNLIALCEGRTVNCHLAVGHLFNWASYNKDVVADAAWITQKVKDRP